MVCVSVSMNFVVCLSIKPAGLKCHILHVVQRAGKQVGSSLSRLELSQCERACFYKV